MTASLAKVCTHTKSFHYWSIFNVWRLNVPCVCSDIDECSLYNPTHDCDQICSNTDGGFNCSCVEGYLLTIDNRSCEGMYPHKLITVCVWSYTFHMVYSDIDECSLYNNCNQICNNTDGGFYCSCEEGYLLANDSKSCKGIIPTQTHLIYSTCQNEALNMYP